MKNIGKFISPNSFDKRSERCFCTLCCPWAGSRPPALSTTPYLVFMESHERIFRNYSNSQHRWKTNWRQPFWELCRAHRGCFVVPRLHLACFWSFQQVLSPFWRKIKSHSLISMKKCAVGYSRFWWYGDPGLRSSPAPLSRTVGLYPTENEPFPTFSESFDCVWEKNEDRFWVFDKKERIWVQKVQNARFSKRWAPTNATKAFLRGVSGFSVLHCRAFSLFVFEIRP